LDSGICTVCCPEVSHHFLHQAFGVWFFFLASGSSSILFPSHEAVLDPQDTWIRFDDKKKLAQIVNVAFFKLESRVKRAINRIRFTIPSSLFFCFLRCKWVSPQLGIHNPYTSRRAGIYHLTYPTCVRYPPLVVRYTPLVADRHLFTFFLTGFSVEVNITKIF
jgi:hypothetical protein